MHDTVRQLGLFDTFVYAIPKLSVGQEVKVSDDEGWEEDNALYGVIVEAPMPFYGKYLVRLDTEETDYFSSDELRKV